MLAGPSPPPCCQLQPLWLCARGKPKFGDRFGGGLESAGRNAAGSPSAERSPRALELGTETFLFLYEEIFIVPELRRAAPVSPPPPQHQPCPGARRPQTRGVGEEGVSVLPLVQQFGQEQEQERAVGGVSPELNLLGYFLNYPSKKKNKN